MGRQHHVRQLRQRVMRRQRLGVEDVEAGTGDPLLRERRDQGSLIDDRAARGIDEIRAPLHEPDPPGVEQTARFRCQREVDRDDVRFAQQLIQFAPPGPGSERCLFGEPRTPRQHAHPERRGDPGDVPADVAQSEDAERLPMQHGRERRHPLAAPDRRIRARDLAHHRHRQADRQLSGAPRKPAGRLGDDHPALRGRSQVDVIRMIAGLRDDAQVRQPFEQRAGELRALAVRDQGIESAQRFGIAERTREDPHFLGRLAKAADAGRAFIGPVDIVENRYAHSPPFSRHRGRGLHRPERRHARQVNGCFAPAA